MGKTDNLTTLKLALELLRRIPRTRRITAQELKRELDAIGMVRTLRTIQMQLEALTQMFEIEREQTRPIGFRWKPQAKGFAVAQMSEQESLLLMLAQRQLAALLPPSLVQAMEGFFQQARRELDPFGDATLARQWLSKVHVSSTLPQLIPPKIAEGVLETVSHALYANLPLRIGYCNAEGRESVKDVLPLGMVQHDARLYLAVLADGYEKPLGLALHRMLEVEAGSVAFERPEHFDLQRFDMDGGISHATGKRVRVSFLLERKAAQHLIESPLAPDQEHVNEGTHVRFRVSYPDSLRLDRWLWSFGPDISEVRKEPIEDAAPAPAVTRSRTNKTSPEPAPKKPPSARKRARSQP